MKDLGNHLAIYATVVYAKNDLQSREILWHELTQDDIQNQEPWVLCGDFNIVLSFGDRLGSDVTQQETQGFQGLLDAMQLTPIRRKGWHFSWSNKQSMETRVYSKIDWALGDFKWIQNLGHVEVEYGNPSVSDHTPIIIRCK